VNVAGMTISDQISRFARATPAGVAFRDGPLTLTWAQTDARIDRLAAALATAGVIAGDRVAVMAGNSVPHLEAMVAIVRTGAICVPVNFRMVAAEVAYVLTDSGASAVLVDDAFAPVVAEARTPDVRAVLTPARATKPSSPAHPRRGRGRSWPTRRPRSSCTRPARRAAPRARCSPTATCCCTPTATS
jgi:acyl-CoA synthetase (AMP-forming)/AMP-acid ligase II